MSLAIRVEVTGDQATIQGLDQLGSELVKMDVAMESIGESLTDYFAGQAFASQGGVYGEVWQALSETYQIYKATGHTTLDQKRWRDTTNTNTYPGRGPLVKTGDMQQGFDYEADSDSVTIFNDVEYFVYHQSDEPRDSNLPRRVMMAINDDVREIIMQIINAEVERKIKEAGF